MRSKKWALFVIVVVCKKRLTLTLAFCFMMTISNLKGYLFKSTGLRSKKWALFLIVIFCKKTANSYTDNLFSDDIFQPERLPFLKSTGLRSKKWALFVIVIVCKKRLTLTLAICFKMTISHLKGYLFKIDWLEIQKVGLVCNCHCL